MLETLPALSLLLAGESGRPTPDVERAVELYALASRHPFVGNSSWFADVAGRHIAAASAALSPEALDAAEARGRTRDLVATAQELLAELEETQET